MSLKNQARAIGQKAAGGIKGTIMSTGVGAATAGVAGYASERVEFLRDKWWSLPAAVVVAGHFLKRKRRDLGNAVLGAGGAMGWYNYKLNEANVRASGGETSGLQDTGSLDGSSDYPSLPEGSETSGLQEAKSTIAGLRAA